MAVINYSPKQGVLGTRQGKPGIKSIIPSPLEVMRKLGLNVPQINFGAGDAAEMLPGAGISDSYSMGRKMSQAIDNKDYLNAALLGGGSALMAGSELLPGIFGSTARKGVKAGLSMTDALTGAGKVYPGSLGKAKRDSNKQYLSEAEQAANARAQAEYYNYPTRDQFIEEGKQSKNLLNAPWSASSSRGLTLDDILSMEAGIKQQPLGSHYQDRNVFSWDQIPVGAYMHYMGGDLSGAGKLINTKAGPTDTLLQAGAEFTQRIDNPAWASIYGNLAGVEKASGGVLTDKLASKFPGLLRLPDDVPVFGVTAPMGPESMNFNKMMSQLMTEQIRSGKILKKDVKEFDQKIKGLNGITKDKRETYPGLSSPKLEKWLDDVGGKTRAALQDEMEKGMWQKKGFPDITSNRAAVTRPNSLWLPDTMDPMTGYNVTKLKKGATRQPSGTGLMGHDTYESTVMADQYMGGPQVLHPRSVIFPDHHQELVKRGVTGSPYKGSWRGSYILQEMTPQLQDNLMRNQEEILKRR
jgi:hypothetical protein